jgi:hypothetical protein
LEIVLDFSETMKTVINSLKIEKRRIWEFGSEVPNSNDRTIFLLPVDKTDLQSNTIFQKTEFLILGRELAKIVKKLKLKRKNTVTMDLILPKSIKSSRQRRQFDHRRFVIKNK